MMLSTIVFLTLDFDLIAKKKTRKLKEKVKKKKLSFLIWKSENFLFVLKNKGEVKLNFVK